MLLSRILLSIHSSVMVTTLLFHSFSLNPLTCWLVFIPLTIVVYFALLYYKYPKDDKKLSWVNYWLLILALNFLAQEWIWKVVFYYDLSKIVGLWPEDITFMVLLLVGHLYVLFLLIFFYVSIKYLKRLKWNVFWTYLFMILFYCFALFAATWFSSWDFIHITIIVVGSIFISFGWFGLIFPAWYWIMKIIKNSMVEEDVTEAEKEKEKTTRKA